jgi:hypothetical protein
MNEEADFHVSHSVTVMILAFVSFLAFVNLWRRSELRAVCFWNSLVSIHIIFAVFEMIGETNSQNPTFRWLALTPSSVKVQLHKTDSKMECAELAKTGTVAMVIATMGLIVRGIVSSPACSRSRRFISSRKRHQPTHHWLPGGGGVLAL